MANTQTKAVFTGAMDTDSSDKYIKAGDYRLLENGIIDHSVDGKRFKAKNLKGTTAVCTIITTGVCIGAKAYKDYIYAFYYNTTSHNTEMYEINTLTTNGYVKIFDKNLSHSATTRIKDIDIIENQTNGDIYCYFNDAINQPFKVNVSWSKLTRTENVETTTWDWVTDFTSASEEIENTGISGSYLSETIEVYDYTAIQVGDELVVSYHNDALMTFEGCTFLAAATDLGEGYFKISATSNEDACDEIAAAIVRDMGVSGGVIQLPISVSVVNDAGWKVSIVFTSYDYDDSESAINASLNDNGINILTVDPVLPTVEGEQIYEFEEGKQYLITFNVCKTTGSTSCAFAKAVITTLSGIVKATYTDIPIYDTYTATDYSISLTLSSYETDFRLFLYPSFDDSDNIVLFNDIQVDIYESDTETTSIDIDNDYVSVSDMYNIRHIPSEPTITPYSNYSEPFINTQDKAFQFAQRWVYQDGEKTPLSTYSKTAYYPSVDSNSLDNSGNISYYISGGNLYAVEDFDSETLITDSLDTAFNKVICNASGSIVLIYSTTDSKKPQISADFGSTFVDCTGGVESIIPSACLSDSGNYIFLMTRSGDVYRSIDYGVTFTKVLNRGSYGSYVGFQIVCSSDGKYVYLAASKVTIFKLFKSSNYGYSFYVTKSRTAFGGIITSACVAISPNAKNVIAAYRNAALEARSYYSGNYGSSFLYKTITGAAHVRVYISNDNKVLGMYTTGSTVNIVTSDDFLDTVSIKRTITTTATDADEFGHYIFSDGVGFSYYKNTLSKYEFARFSVDGTLISTYQSDAQLGFTNVLDLRYVDKFIQNIYNCVDISIEKPNYLVDKAQVYAIDVISGAAYLVEEIKNEDIPSGGTTITFKNNLLYRQLSQTEKGVLFSNVPILAKNQDLCGNRLFYLNYTDGRDMVDVDFDITQTQSAFYSATFSADVTATPYIASSDISAVVYKGRRLIFNFTCIDSAEKTYRIIFEHTFRADYANVYLAASELSESFSSVFTGASVVGVSGTVLFRLPSTYSYVLVGSVSIKDNGLTYKNAHPLKIGIVYYDEYNRGCFPLFDGNDIVINKSTDTPKIKLRATINNTPPTWAVKYKFVRNDRDLLHTIIPGFKYAKYLDGKIWLMKYEEDAYMPDEGMFLDVFDDNGVGDTFIVSSKETKAADFVLGSPAGDWITIADKGIKGLSGVDVMKGSDLFSSYAFYARTNTQTEDGKLFYEIPGVYNITNGLHEGNIQNQTISVPAIVDINDDGNVFFIDSVNIESNKISYAGNFANGGRALIETDQVGEINRYSSFCWSDAFVQDTGYNGLSMFNLGVANFKELGIEYGEIYHSEPQETNMFIWQKDKVGYVLINKDAITTATGSDIISSSNNVVGEYIPYSGVHGCDKGESVSIIGNSAYFTDIKRKAICRLAADGINEISDYYLKTDINAIMNTATNFYSCVNVDNGEYWLYDKYSSKIIIFDEKQNRWSRYISPITVHAMVSTGKRVFTFYNSVMYSHMTSTTYGNIHGAQLTFKLKYTDNTASDDNKVYNAVCLESNRAVDVLLDSEGMTSSIDDADFEEREYDYFAYVPNSGSVTDTTSDLETSMIIPLGDVLDSTVGTFILKIDPNATWSTINHDIYYVSAGVPVLFGTLVSITGTTVVTTNTTAANDFLNDKFVFAKEKSYLNARNLRGSTVDVTLTDAATTYLEIEGVNINISKSEV